MSFAELGLSASLLKAVEAEGYTNPTPIQAQSIPHVVAGRDLLGCAQTGTGKTAAFALPILHRLTHAGNPPRGAGRRVRVLVLAPTRELAIQIADSFHAYGRNTALRQVVVCGGVSQVPQVRALRHGVDIVVATPGRLLDLVQQRAVDLSHVEVLVLDEADRMLDMGFLPDVRRIIDRVPQNRQTLFFSATMPGPIEALARDILCDPAKVRITPAKATTELIEQSVCFVEKIQKPKLLAGLLREPKVDRAIVFTRTKHGADRVAHVLQKSGIRAESIHGDKSQSARQRALAGFKSSHLRVLVATDLAARGIDVDGVTHVVNYDIPRDPETYVHRIGRTGRAGASGVAISFCDGEERSHLKAIERLIRKAIPVRQAGHVPAAPNAETPEVTEALDAAVAPTPPQAERTERPERSGGQRAQQRSGGSRPFGGPRKGNSSRFKFQKRKKQRRAASVGHSS